MSAGDRRTELRPFGWMATDAGAVGHGAEFVILARDEVDVVVTGRTNGDARKLLPLIFLRFGVAGLAVSQFFIAAVAKHGLRDSTLE